MAVLYVVVTPLEGGGPTLPLWEILVTWMIVFFVGGWWVHSRGVCFKLGSHIRANLSGPSRAGVGSVAQLAPRPATAPPPAGTPVAFRERRGRQPVSRCVESRGLRC